jgi:hypothetical protein
MKITPKLNVAWVEGRPYVQLESSEWSQLEAAYGQPLPATLRVQIQDLTNKFLEFAVFELAAAPVSDAIERAEMLSKPGATLLEILCVGHDNHAVMAADSVIEKHLRDLSVAHPYSFDLIRDMASCLVAACRKAARELEARKPSGLREGEHWQRWVYRLKVSFENHGLRATARTDYEGNAAWKPSPFVSLIDTLQDYIPSKYRRVSTPEGFSKAISRAWKEMRPPSSDKSRRRTKKADRVRR